MENYQFHYEDFIDFILSDHKNHDRNSLKWRSVSNAGENCSHNKINDTSFIEYFQENYAKEFFAWKRERRKERKLIPLLSIYRHTQYNNNNEEEEGETAIAERRKTAATAAVAMRKNEKSFLIKNLY